MKFRQLLIITGIVFIISLFAAATILSNINYEKHFETVEYNTVQTFSDNINTININVVSTNIEVTQTTTEEIIITHVGTCLFGTFKEDVDLPEQEFIIEQEGDQINAYMKHEKWDFFIYHSECNGSIQVEVPQSYDKQLTIETVSSDTTININELSKLRFEGVSADMTTTANINEVKAETVSGDLTFQEIETADISSVSGDISLKLKRDQDIYFESVSGDVRPQTTINPNSKIHIDTVSADVKITT